MQTSSANADYQEHVQAYRSFVRGVANFVAHVTVVLAPRADTLLRSRAAIITWN